IDEKLADIHEIQDVDIEGSIKSGTTVKCRNLTVHGNLLGEVVTTGDVLVKGRVGDKPDEKTNDISIAKIKANGKVMIAKDIVYSDIQANGSIIASKSHVSASWLSAKNEILVEEIEVDDTHNVNITIGVHDNNIIKEIDKKILDKKELLDVMDKSDEKCNWERNINLCIQAQDDIREKHNTLKFINELSIKGDVWNKLNFKNLDPLQIMEQIQFYISKTPGLVSCPPKDTGAYMYLERVIKSLKSLDHEKQLKFIKKIYKDGIQDYRAAVKTTEKIENAYQVFKKKSNQETVNESEIEHLKNEINVLSAEKDLMHIALERNYRITPMLKVKRKIARGAIIKGVNAIMENENDLYGIIIYETKNNSKQWEMIIENYYQ
ncbi:MAG: DUF342 domain-containing protein, partial [archaeon]|nr:DUF342 domain-containing protein [archaeon]